MTPLTALNSVANSIATDATIDQTLAALSNAYNDVVGHGMLTILLYDRAAGKGRRIFSTSPLTHAVGAYKAIPRTAWRDQVLDRQEVFVAENVAAFRPHYSDWGALEQMGLLSGVNFPVVIAGTTIGSINLTARSENFYTPERIAAGGLLSLASAAVLLLQERIDRSAREKE